MIPLIFLSSVINFALLASIYGLVRDILIQGLLVWNRDNLGKLLCHLIVHISILCFCVKMYRYIQIKESDQREQDPVVEDAASMSFADAFRPLYILITLYFFKLLMCKAEFDFVKFIMAISVIGISIIGDTYFDKDQNNDASLVILAVPISAILFAQAAIDFLFWKNTIDVKKRVFYGLDNPLKKIWIAGNCFATTVYSVCLFKWLYII